MRIHIATIILLYRGFVSCAALTDGSLTSLAPAPNTASPVSTALPVSEAPPVSTAVSAAASEITNEIVPFLPFAGPVMNLAAKGFRDAECFQTQKDGDSGKEKLRMAS